MTRCDGNYVLTRVSVRPPALSYMNSMLRILGREQLEAFSLDRSKSEIDSIACFDFKVLPGMVLHCTDLRPKLKSGLIVLFRRSSEK